MCLLESHGCIVRPTDLSLPPLIQLSVTAEISDLSNKIVGLLTVDAHLVDKDVGQRMVTWLTVWQACCLTANAKLSDCRPKRKIERERRVRIAAPRGTVERGGGSSPALGSVKSPQSFHFFRFSREREIDHINPRQDARENRPQD